MSLPGFTRTSPPAPPGDRLVLQHFTCEEELGPHCENICERSWNPARCVRDCIRRNCYTDRGPR
ncbi:hypothetical protein [Streptomyces sp. NPDC058739]|uniref:hypothetical protein n=1 Tax=Streptomyces sp. NPDC058739 TaxID=3346618 RepID=UPI0036C79089